MDLDPQLATRITAEISRRMELSKTPIPIGVSNRHVHMSQEHWDALFGQGSRPTKYRDTRQPGWWAANETVDLQGPKGRIGKVRLVGPHRPKTQVELSRTDAMALGINPPVRGSGKVSGSCGVRIIGPKATIDLQEGAIIASRHLHLHPREAQAMGLKDGEIMRVRCGIGGPRELVLEQVLVRVSDSFALELHLDTDEANAAWVKSGELCNIC